MKANFPSLLGLPSEQRKIFDFLRQRLQNGLTIADNQFATLLDFSFDRDAELTHGTETQFKNSLRSVPIGFEAIYAEDINGNALEISRCKLNKRPLGGDGEVRDGYLGITPEFDLQHTKPCLIKTASATQSIPNNAGTVLTGWDTTTKSRGSVITDDGSTFTVSEAGTYFVSLYTQFESGTYTAIQNYILLPGAVRNYAQTYAAATFADTTEWTSSGVIPLAAGGTFTAGAYQTNGAAAARNVTNGAANGRRITIHRLYNDTVQTGRVIGILWGA